MLCYHSIVLLMVTRMKRILALLLCGIACGRAQEVTTAPSPSFVGYLSSAGEWQFAVTPERGARPIWLRLGETAGSLTLRSYDQASETLDVELNGQLLQLKLEEGTARSGAPAIMPAAATMDRRQAMLIARREVLARERWRNPRLFVSITANGNYQVLISQSTALRTERRTLVLRPDGQIAFYLELAALPQGVPDLLFGGFTAGKPYGFIGGRK
jgi:hypothetical protein